MSNGPHRTLKLPSKNGVPFTIRCVGNEVDSNANLCAEVLAAIACAPSNITEGTLNGLTILSTAATQNAIKADVRSQKGCAGRFELTGCLRPQTGVSNSFGINTTKNADGTDVDGAFVNCDLDKASALNSTTGASTLASSDCGC